MIRALFTAATGMNAQEINVATISNNIANGIIVRNAIKNLVPLKVRGPILSIPVS